MKNPKTIVKTGGLALVSLGCLATIGVQAELSVTTLCNFNGTNGHYPRAIIQATDGNLYGTTWAGGSQTNFGNGSVFKLTPDGALTTLASFGVDHDTAEALIQGSDGNLYGSTFFGGPGGWQGDGTLFKLTTSGALTSLVSFAGTNGAGPHVLIEARDGNFYGTTLYGGEGYLGLGSLTGCGTIFRLDTNGLHTPLAFFNGTNGAMPCSLIQAEDGNFYGVTITGGNGFDPFNSSSPDGQGTVFQMTPDGTITTLHFFENTNRDYTVPRQVLQARDGNLYGVTEIGGEYDLGTVFRVTLDGAFTTLWSFDGTNGATPNALVESPEGNFYGATESGSAGNLFSDQGTLFRITPQGEFTRLAFLVNSLRPQIGFMQAPDGNFYGTATEGGTYNHGTVFRLSVPLPPVLQTPSQSSDVMNLRWTSVAGQSYQLQYNTDLSSTNWNDLGSVVLATNGVMSAFDLIGSDLQRFYRVGVLP
jgi:uncharacterized repeat protein (TIGR03803 family)